MDRIRSTRASIVTVAGTLWLAACGGDGGSTPTPTGPTPTPTPIASTFRGSASDPNGDALRDARVPISPDVTATTVDIESGTVRIVVQFVPGTFNADTTWIQVLLDTDESAGTGLPGLSSGADATAIGVDYWVDLAVRGIATPRAALVRCSSSNPASCRDVSAVTANLGTDRVEFTYPASLLSDDGRMRIKTTVGSGVANVEMYDTDLDVVPDAGLPAMLVR